MRPYEVVHLCTDTELSPNSMDFLERFIIYFEFQAHDLIVKKENPLIYLPGFLSPLSQIPQQTMLSDLNFFPDEYYINIHSFQAIKISQREMQCLMLTLNGGSAKEVGKFLNLSHRTVEKNIVSH